MPITLRSKSGRLTALVSLAGVLLATSMLAPAWGGEKTVHTFEGGTDGDQPSGGLTADQKGNLFGATAGGGAGTGCYGGAGCGTIYKIRKSGQATVFYSFPGGSDGIGPSGDLLMDGAGNIFGTTIAGGGNGCTGYGCGTVFKLAPDGSETQLYTFHGVGDGFIPQGSLIEDDSGNLYGAASEGGSFNGSLCEESGCGTVFEVQPDGTEITLYAFQGGSDGAFPAGGLISDASGNLYGTTDLGGSCSYNSSGCGVVFKVAPDGTESVLYAFQGGSDGELPEAGLVADSAGNLYGTTSFGGNASKECGCGVVFKVSPSGQETILYAFQAGNDGANPEAGLAMDKDGNLFGTTIDGGGKHCSNKGWIGCGVVFKLTLAGVETVLFRFGMHGDGSEPSATLLLDKHHALYGTTADGGKYKDGVVFKLKE
jgi:uncharacterized repeat protein (TIGR03803 family)